MRQFYNLRSLTSSLAVLRTKVFFEISRLPLLESLILKSTETRGPIRQYKGLSGSSFPSLRQLELHYVDPNVIAHLCSLVPLVRHLERVTIHFPEGADDEHWDFDGDRVESTLGILSQLSPRLRHFCLHTGPDADEIEIDDILLESLQRLPLRYLDLGSLRITSSLGLDGFGAAVPLLEELHLDLATYSPEQLHPLAALLPYLRFLELGYIDVDLDDYEDENSPIEFPSSPINQSQVLIRIKCGPYYKPWSLESFAR